MPICSTRFPREINPEDGSIIEDCSAVIVGKKASSTGLVLYGHNEDDPAGAVMAQYRVPRETHKAGEMLAFEPECAKIPQALETWAYFWSETRASYRPSFSDTFINEWGVAMASDSCTFSREDLPRLTEGGIGYGLYHVVMQRAKTARQGVEIAAAMLDKYGYVSSGRTYQMVDKNEGWVLQVVNGKHYVAKRVPDDEVFFMPNWFTIHGVDLADRENYVASPDIITYALDRGWYRPAKQGDFSDFDFAVAYQNPTQSQAGNSIRHKNALRLILGREPEDIRAFSVKPAKQMSVESVKKILRTHYEGTDDDLSQGYSVNPHRTGKRCICAGTTIESFVVEFQPEPELTCVWRALDNACTSPYAPWYLGATQAPQGYSWLAPELALSTHFNVPAPDLSYRPGRAWWAFQSVQDLADASYATVIPHIVRARDALEAQWKTAQADTEAKARLLLAEDPSKAAAFLTGYTNTQATLAWHTWYALFNDLMKQ